MAFTLYKEIRYALDGIPGANLTDFPKLFIISGDAAIAAECSGGGGIQVKSADGSTVLPIELVDSLTALASGDVAFFVKLSPLTAANVGDPFCRLYYDGAETTTEDAANVWDANFVGPVWHLEENPTGGSGAILDSTSNNRDGTASNMESGDLVATGIGNGLDFDGSSERISTASTYTWPASGLTVEVVINPDSMPVAGIVSAYAAVGNVYLQLFCLTGGDLHARIHQGSGVDYIGRQTPTTTLTTGAEQHIAATWDGSTSASGIKIFRNGTQVDNAYDSFGSFTAANSNAMALELAAQNADAFWDGKATELRVSDDDRSADWIAYTAQDLLNNADTFTLGAEQGGGGGGATIPALDQGMLTGGLSTLCGGLI